VVREDPALNLDPLGQSGRVRRRIGDRGGHTRMGEKPKKKRDVLVGSESHAGGLARVKDKRRVFGSSLHSELWGGIR